MTEPLVSVETCNAFPIAICIVIAGLSALLVGWKLIADALAFRRFCLACGGRESAFVVIESAEATADAAAEVLGFGFDGPVGRNYELTSDYRIRLAAFNEDSHR